MSQSLLKSVRSFGLILFLIGLFTFSLSLFLGTYSLTEDILTGSVTSSSDREKLSLALKPMLDKTYSNQFEFVREYHALFNDLNETAKREGKWGEVIYADYSFILTKNSTQGFLRENQASLFFFAIIITLLGALLYILPNFSLLGIAGIKNNGVWSNPASNCSWLGFLSAAYLIGFYMFLYFYPEYITGWVLLVEPVSLFLSGKPADQWFLYGFLYTASALVMGVRMFTKYRHSNYQLLRTASVMFFQSAFAFLIPEILKSLNLPSRDLKNIFPLDYSFFYDYNLNYLSSSGTLGLFMLFWGVVLFVLGVPIMTYFFGKRWYCSWVCGCGGLAETLGDPYRQLSDKSLKAWKVERILIHSVLVFSAVLLTFSLYSYFTHESSLLGVETWRVRQAYGFLIGAVFSGVVGTGFYPVMGSRVWCRFGCPLAAYLGIIQRFKSRFRITTNGGQCISCGNCSTYCEMGIDVRAYAQRGENIVRSSCVGCGVCAAVCPRGVLSLENGPEEFRLQELIK
ncbi:MAG: 4Fe-4S binding protein [Chloroherpetonaceae bacterium]|nr:4Fe-4S binding protein [Chloroherpetonaceae bacterium]